MLKTLEKIARDPRVEEVGDESGTGDGYWVYLKDGYIGDEAHAVHEWTIRRLVESMRRVKVCNCEDCQKAKAKA